MEVKFLPGVGPKKAELLQKELDVSTVGELLRVFPFRYIDRSSFVRIADARPDMAYVQIKATVMRIDVHDGKRMSAWGRLRYDGLWYRRYYGGSRTRRA